MEKRNNCRSWNENQTELLHTNFFTTNTILARLPFERGAFINHLVIQASMGIHEVTVSAPSGDKKKLSDFGIQMQKLSLQLENNDSMQSIVQNQLPQSMNNRSTVEAETKRHRKVLRIKSLGETFESPTLSKGTDMSSGLYEIIGINGKSCRGASFQQIERIILQENTTSNTKKVKNGKNEDRDIILLIQGHGDSDKKKGYSARGIQSGCFCDNDCTECCTIQ